jgi:hypothetical protein
VVVVFFPDGWSTIVVVFLLKDLSRRYFAKNITIHAKRRARIIRRSQPKTFVGKKPAPKIFAPKDELLLFSSKTEAGSVQTWAVTFALTD